MYAKSWQHGSWSCTPTSYFFCVIGMLPAVQGCKRITCSCKRHGNTNNKFCQQFTSGDVKSQNDAQRTCMEPLRRPCSSWTTGSRMVLLGRFCHQLIKQFISLQTQVFDEDKTGGLGGILLGDNGQVLAWFSLMLDVHQVQNFMEVDTEVVIGELEALAPILALDLWADMCRSKHVIFYIDNDGARYSLIKGYSASISLSLLSRMLAVRLEQLVCIQWFARVASSSNLADFPSRNMSHPLLLERLRCDDTVTLDIFNQCVDEFVVDHLERVGLGKVANKTNGSSTNACSKKRKVVSWWRPAQLQLCQRASK